MKQQLNIEDYFLIGDLYSAALVSSEGSIDWLCLPYFDSPSVFGRILDPEAGFYSIDTTGFKVSCSYLKDTAIVQRTLSQAGFTVLSKDYMVPQDTAEYDCNQYLIRKIIATEGSGEVSFVFCLKPNYALDDPQFNKNDGKLQFSIGDSQLILHTPKGAKIEDVDGSIRITIPISFNEEKYLALEYIPDGKTSADLQDQESVTADYWHRWVGKGTYMEFCRDNLVRSAITLKLMQFSPTGAIVAAPTTSLPEDIGGVRNWDYRYVWIRDATFTLYAFHVLGYEEEARKFFDFVYGILEKTSNEDFDVSLMYTIHGEPVPEEKTLDHLQGYKDSRPVRIGNEAAKQHQLDVYGALIDAYYVSSKAGIVKDRTKHTSELVMRLIRKIEQEWNKTDSGIWEVRSQTQHYTYSKVMCWVGADRAHKMSEVLGLSDNDRKLCEQLAVDIKDWVWEHCYDTNGSKNMLQHPDTDAIDSTNFLFVLLQFLDKHEDISGDIVHQTQQTLIDEVIFVRRYTGYDGLPGKEGAFILCSFWLISALAILEEVDEALDLFKRLEAFMAPHGLLAEEVDPITKRYLGNYPQSFSHLGYIMTAHYLHKYLERAKQPVT